MITFALLTPLILPIATVAFGVVYLAYRHILLYLADAVVDTRGRLYFSAFFHLFSGLYAQQLTLIGLFVFKFNRRQTAHDLGQLAILVTTALACVQYHVYLQRHCARLVRCQEGTLVRPPRTTPAVSEKPEGSLAPAMRPRFRMPTADRGSLVVVWLPRDEQGVSESLIDRVRTTLLSPTADMVTVTNSGASITADGCVTLHEDGDARPTPSRPGEHDHPLSMLASAREKGPHGP